MKQVIAAKHYNHVWACGAFVTAPTALTESTITRRCACGHLSWMRRP